MAPIGDDDFEPSILQEFADSRTAALSGVSAQDVDDGSDDLEHTNAFRGGIDAGGIGGATGARPDHQDATRRAVHSGARRRRERCGPE